MTARKARFQFCNLVRYDRNMFKKYVKKKLQKYVVKYFELHPHVKLIVVAGSVGKTSTKRALGDLLVQRYRVRMHEGNYNSEVSAPLAILGIDLPENLRSPLAWLGVFRAARRRVYSPADTDVIIQELGVDQPGDMAEFSAYLRPDLALVTAVTLEHMENFGTIEAVAQEELSVLSFSQAGLINRDDIDGRFADFINNPNFSTYGTSGSAEYRFEAQRFDVDTGFEGTIIAADYGSFPAVVKVVGEHSLRPIMGAVGAALMLGLAPEDVVRGLSLVKPVPGRMNILHGIGGVAIIDDTYNSSPAAAAAALQTLYSFDDAAERIAVLGDMRELGASSQIEHEKLGSMCDPNLLTWVVTVGPESEKYLAPVARRRGCQVHVARNAIEAGEFVRSVTQGNAVVLVKGSQDTIYLEECVKILCNMTEDDELVRQSPEWVAKKDEFFQQFK